MYVPEAVQRDPPRLRREEHPGGLPARRHDSYQCLLRNRGQNLVFVFFNAQGGRQKTDFFKGPQRGGGVVDHPLIMKDDFFN